jgi:hypothetical protein
MASAYWTVPIGSGLSSISATGEGADSEIEDVAPADTVKLALVRRKYV